MTADTSFRLVNLGDLVESPSNHRSKSWGAMDELVESIRAKGVVRKRDALKAECRAALAAGKETT